jgi:predicted O-methyltransferase YrrM
MLCAHSVFEIGTFTGVSAFALAVNVPQLIVHTLDLPVGRVPALDFEKSDRTFIPLHSRQRVFEGRQEAARIIQHEGDSASFNFSTLGRTFDLVYVDGAHSYDYVANDSRAAFDIVADGGAIVWDDYQPRWPGVVRYLNERTDLSLYRVPGTRLVLWLSEQAKSTLSTSHQPTDD